MKVNVIGRHVQVSPALESCAQERFSKLDRFFSGIDRAEVVLDLDGHGAGRRCLVEASVLLGRGVRLVGKGLAGQMEAAIDMAGDRLEKQIRRFHARLKARRDRTRIGANHTPAEGRVSDEETYEQVVREMLEEGEE